MAETVFEKDVAGSVPLPMCVVDESGKIVSCNAHMNEVFLYDGLVGSDFFQLTGVKIAGLTETAESSDYKTIERNGKSFRLFASMNMSEQNNNIFVFFDDVTSYEDVRKNYEEGRLCCCIVRIDNYDELMASTLPDMRMDISSQLDTMVSNIEYLIKTGEEESVCANATSDSFLSISDSVKEIIQRSEGMNISVSNLAMANDEIVNSIQTISAITEEVTAHASNTYDSSEQNKEIVEHINTLVTGLNADAEELKSYI